MVLRVFWNFHLLFPLECDRFPKPAAVLFSFKLCSALKCLGIGLSRVESSSFLAAWMPNTCSRTLCRSSLDEVHYPLWLMEKGSSLIWGIWTGLCFVHLLFNAHGFGIQYNILMWFLVIYTLLTKCMRTWNNNL